MKNTLKGFYRKSSCIIYKKAISISLAFIFLFNLSAQAFLPENFVPKEIENEIREVLEEIVQPELSPKEYLQEVLKDIEKSIEETNNQTEEEKDNQTFKKKTKEEYIKEYNIQAQKEYQGYIEEIEKETQNALEEFDKFAQAEIEKQTKLLEQTNNKNNSQSNLFTQTNPLENTIPITAQIALNNFEKQQKQKANQTAENNTSFNLKFKQKTDTNPLNTKLELNLGAAISSSKTYQEYRAKQNMSQVKQKYLTAKTQEFGNKIEELKIAIEKERGLYTQEVINWKSDTLNQLNTEHQSILNAVDDNYKKYSAPFDKEYAELQNQEIAFYQHLMHKIVENFKKIDEKDLEAQKNFISILFYLTSIQHPSNEPLIMTNDKQFISDFLRKKIQYNQGQSCSGTTKTYYNYENSSNKTWSENWATSPSIISQSPTAAKMYETQSAKKISFELSTKDECDIAISSLIPYGNINGDGLVIYNFISKYWDKPMFGAILPFAAKALTLTENGGYEYLSTIIDVAIKKENEERAAHNGFWETMNMFTAEGISTSKMYDGKYCQHNVCSSADTGYNQPNAWEEVARYIIDRDWTDMLKVVTAQCKIVTEEDTFLLRDTGTYSQHLRCGGVYPLLFGTLLYAPELANSLFADRFFPEDTHPYTDKNGKIKQLTPDQAQYNKELNDKIDILKKYGKAELMTYYLLYQSFEDLHPENQNRMVADVLNSKHNKILNPKNKLKVLDKNSGEYRKILAKYNGKQVVWGGASYADIVIMLTCVRDIFRLFLGIRNVVNLLKVIRTYKKIPFSFTKSIKIAHALKSKGVGVEYVKKLHKFIKFTKAPLATTTSAVISKLGGKSSIMVGSISGRITGAKNGVLIGTSEVYRPVSKSARSSSTYRQGSLGGYYSTHANNLPAKTPRTAKADVSFKLYDKKGNPIEVKTIEIQNGVLYINGEMMKTFKAKIPAEQLEVINDLVSKHKIKLGIDDMYVKAIWKDYKPTSIEKLKGRNNFSEMVDIYNEEGQVIMKLGLNRGYGPEAALLKRLGIPKPLKGKKAAKMPTKTNNSRLIYMNNTLFIEEGGQLTELAVQEFFLPKTALFNMLEQEKLAFLKDIFTMPSKAASKAPLNFFKTKNKILWPFVVQSLSYSAAASGLMLTLEQKPFERSPITSMWIGLGLAYAFTLAAPLFSPLVKKLGSRTLLNYSLGFGVLGLGVACFTGYNGNVTYQTDSEGRVLKVDSETAKAWQNDENKKKLIDSEGRLFRRKDQLLPIWPLYASTLITGLASAGVRASSNVILKTYETSRKTLTLSMFPKNLGGMAFTLFPFLWNRAAQSDNPKLSYFKDKHKDFSFSYPVLLGATLITIAGLRFTLPKMAIPNYVIKLDDFLRPVKLFKNNKIWPYVAGMALACSLEGYVFFKGFNAFARDTYEQDVSKVIGKNIGREDAKFMASLTTALPQMALRLWAPRTKFFGRGLFNSAILSATGTAILMIPSSKLGPGQNIGLGALAGIMIGSGTANVYQYSQKLILAQAKTINAVGNVTKDTQILYSMSNLGLVLPAVFCIDATRRKEELGEGEFEANRNTFKWALLSYALGMGLILKAEKSSALVALNDFKTKLIPVVNQAAPTLNKFVLRPANYILTPTLRYGLELGVLTKLFREQKISSLQLQPIKAPKAGINFNPYNTTNFNNSLKTLNTLQFQQTPAPQLSKDENTNN